MAGIMTPTYQVKLPPERQITLQNIGSKKNQEGNFISASSMAERYAFHRNYKKFILLPTAPS